MNKRFKTPATPADLAIARRYNAARDKVLKLTNNLRVLGTVANFSREEFEEFCKDEFNQDGFFPSTFIERLYLEYCCEIEAEEQEQN